MLRIYFFIVCKINSIQIAECLIHAQTCRKGSSRLRPLRHHKFAILDCVTRVSTLLVLNS